MVFFWNQFLILHDLCMFDTSIIHWYSSTIPLICFCFVRCSVNGWESKCCLVLASECWGSGCNFILPYSPHSSAICLKVIQILLFIIIVLHLLCSYTTLVQCKRSVLLGVTPWLSYIFNWCAATCISRHSPQSIDQYFHLISITRSQSSRFQNLISSLNTILTTIRSLPSTISKIFLLSKVYFSLAWLVDVPFLRIICSGRGTLSCIFTICSAVTLDLCVDVSDFLVVFWHLEFSKRSPTDIDLVHFFLTTWSWHILYLWFVFRYRQFPHVVSVPNFSFGIWR